MTRPSLPLFLLALCLALCACHGPGHVEFAHEQCLIDGHPATLVEVEERQAQVTKRILSRQPLFVIITLLVVALAGASHAEKLVFLFSTRGAEVKGIGERVRLALDRYRAHPVRYFTIVASTLLLLLLAASCYIYLDAEKRANERALGQLQFCHLALRTSEEKTVLDEQRRNLQTIQATAGDIRTLVNKLPPEEKRKAQEIIDQMGLALSQQGKLVGEYLHRTDESSRALQQHTEALQRGLSMVEADVGTLKALPAGLHDLAEQVRRLDAAVKTVDGKVTDNGGRLSATDARLGACDARLGAMEGALKALADRPACPACVCEPARPPKSEEGTRKAPAAAPASPASAQDRPKEPAAPGK